MKLIIDIPERLFEVASKQNEVISIAKKIFKTIAIMAFFGNCPVGQKRPVNHKNSVSDYSHGKKVITFHYILTIDM